MKDKYKHSEQGGPTVSKSSNKESTRASSRQAKSKQQHEGDRDAKYATDDEKNYEVGIVEIASNLSDLSGSTGDHDSSADDVQQLSTRNADAKEFEILIQAKHAEACKAMGVSSILAGVLNCC
jgi:hypothetical protein